MVISSSRRRHLHIGFISTRFEGIDGVSLETEKWCTVLERIGHHCFFFAGISDQSEDISYVIPEAHFNHPEIREISDQVFSLYHRPPLVTQKIDRLKQYLKSHLHEFVKQFDLDMLIVENAVTIPMNIPLGMAITELIAETGIPTIAHHHDFYWERQRFLKNCVMDYLSAAFPPRLPSIQHVVINSLAAYQLSLRTGNSATIIPNVMDFAAPPPAPDEYVSTLKKDLRIQPGIFFFLQPTRIVQRKGIEHAIELTRRVGLPARLVITHASGDEKYDYETRLHEYAHLLSVQVNFISDIVQDSRGTTSDGRKIYSLADTYQQADLVTYPSTIEGFGNAFLEAIYYKKPVIVNNYSIYDLDIKPKGFKAIEFEGYLTDDTLRLTREILEDPNRISEMVEHNYELGKRFYSYHVLEGTLRNLIMNSFGHISAIG